MEKLILAGVALMLLGFVVTAAGVLLSAVGGEKTSVKTGGVVFLGPIPVVFGSDRNTAVTAAVLGLMLMAAYYFFVGRRV